MNILEERSIKHPEGPTLVIGNTVKSDRVIEAFSHKHDKKQKNLVIAGESLINSNIDVGWLTAAADTYDISSDPRDYILVDVPIVTVDIPNRNLQAFPYEEVSYFDPLQGKMVYQSFDGKPCHIDHDNKDPLKAKGVIFDSALEFVPAYNVWKIRILTGWDRTKDNWLIEQILRKKRNAYSMGALVGAFVCSVCGQIDTNIRKCRCMMKNGGNPGAVMPGNYLVFQQCADTNFIECSSVDDPADITADTDEVWG